LCISLLTLLDLSEKIDISCSSSFAYYSLNTITAVSLSIPLVRLVLQSVEKYGVRRRGRGISWKRAPSACTFVFLPAILVFRPLAVSLGLIRRTNGCLSSIVCSLIAKRTLAPSRAASADSSPTSLKRAGNRVVFQTGRTPLAASAKIDFTILTCAPSLVLLVLMTSPVSLCHRAGRILPAYYASVPYKINGSTQVVTAFLSEEAGGPSFVRARLRIY
jgi:hypothetical protein